MHSVDTDSERSGRRLLVAPQSDGILIGANGVMFVAGDEKPFGNFGLPASEEPSANAELAGNTKLSDDNDPEVLSSLALVEPVLSTPEDVAQQFAIVWCSETKTDFM